MREPTTRETLKNLAFLALALGAIFLLAHYFDFAEVRRYIDSAGAWGPLVLVVAKASTIVVAPLSGSPLYPLAGAVWGFWKAFGLLVLGDAIGSTIAFYISRVYGKSLAERMMGGERGLLAEALEMMGTVRGFALARLAFASFPEIAAYGAGLTKIHYVPFITIHIAVSLVPNTILTALGTLLVEGGGPLFFAGLFGVGALVSGVSFFLFYKLLERERVQKSRNAKSETSPGR
jgi:uncharacterized membrane protein YdjX (TVP38/TMEM64 family)